ncbi:hypothetical protein Tco_0173687 [Tanacetum coccineum]
MVIFQRLHSHLKRLSNNDLKGSRTENGFGRVFATLFGQDFEIFTGMMFLNMDQLQKQLDNNEFQEIGSMASFKVLERNQLQLFFQEILVPIYDEESMAEVQMTADDNVSATGTLHTEILKSNNEREKVDQNADQSLKNELRKLTGNSVNTKFAKPSILGKPVLQPHRNQFVVRQPTAFKSERPKISKERFASKLIESIRFVHIKPVTTHYLPKRRESAPAKPHYMIATSSSSLTRSDTRNHDHRMNRKFKAGSTKCSLAVKTAYITTRLEYYYSLIIAMLRDNRLGNQSYDPIRTGRILPMDIQSLELQFLAFKMRHSIRMLVKDTRSQDGIDDKDNDKGSKSRSQSMKEQAYNNEQEKDQDHMCAYRHKANSLIS